MQTSAINQNTSSGEVTYPLTPTVSATLRTVDDPRLEASISGSVLSGSPLKQPLPLKRSPPDQLHSP